MANKFALVDERVALSAAYLLQMAGDELAQEVGARLMRAIMPAGQNEALKTIYDRREGTKVRMMGDEHAAATSPA